MHFTNIDRDYEEVMRDIEKEWESIDKEYNIPSYSHVSVGWDNNPHFEMITGGIMKNNTPGNFEKALRQAKTFVDNHPNQAPLITINSWNEWTETSYLQPYTMYGYGYLEAVKKVLEVEDTEIEDFEVARPFINKYNHPHAKYQNTDNNWPIYRYSDALLLLSECLVNQGKSDEALLSFPDIG